MRLSAAGGREKDAYADTCLKGRVRDSLIWTLKSPGFSLS